MSDSVGHICIKNGLPHVNWVSVDIFPINWKLFSICAEKNQAPLDFQVFLVSNHEKYGKYWRFYPKKIVDQEMRNLSDGALPSYNKNNEANTKIHGR